MGTHRRGVLWLDASRTDPSWRQPDINSGLGLRDSGGNLFLPVPALAAAPDRQLVFAGGTGGVFRTKNDDPTKYEACSAGTFTEKVTLPSTWLFCSGAHEVQAVHDDAP